MTVAYQISTIASDLFPNGGWDVHHHIFDPAKFAYAPDRHLTPPPATIKQFLEFKRKFGITNSVLTHGLSYGADCTSLKTFVSESGTNDTKAIGVIDPSTVTFDELTAMHAAGVRGIRVNLYKYQATHDVGLQETALCEHALAIRKHDNAQNWKEQLVPAGIRLVTDHFALLKGASMLAQEPNDENVARQQPGFKEILDLVRAGHLYVKISAPYRVNNQAPGYEDLKPLVRALVDANPQRALWGSDWPHTPHMKVGHEKRQCGRLNIWSLTIWPG